MLCGDETGGIVVDVGSWAGKFGFAGEDTPKAVFDTHVGVTSSLVGEDGVTSKSGAGVSAGSGRQYTVGAGLRVPKAGMDVKSPLDLGIVEDWDAMERVWEYGFRHLLRKADVSDHPIMIAEPPYSISTQREKIAEIMFEKFNVPALYLARSPTLGAFSAGRASAIVVDIGASCTRVTPVYDGYVLTKGAHMSEVGGCFLTEALQQNLMRSGSVAEVLPRYAVKRVLKADDSGKSEAVKLDTTGITHSYRQWAEMEVLDDVKKSLCYVHETGYDESHPPAPGSYDLPDGSVLKVGDAREQMAELLFRAEAVDGYKNLVSARSTAAWLSHYQAQVTLRHPSKDGNLPTTPVPLQQAIHSALLASGAEIRRDMCNNVILTGGGSNLKDIHKRLHWELLTLIPSAFKPRVIAPLPVEREFATWIGGSILSSLGTFQQLWVSRAEYEEEGAAAIDRKCNA